MHATKYSPAENYISVLVSALPSLTGIGRTHWHEAIKNGRIKAYKQGRRTIVMREDLNDYLKNLPDACEHIAAGK